MLIKNKTPNIYQLRSGSKRLQVNPWQILEIPAIFQQDSTFRMAIRSGSFIRLDVALAAEPPAETLVQTMEKPKTEEPENGPEEVTEEETPKKSKTAKK